MFAIFIIVSLWILLIALSKNNTILNNKYLNNSILFIFFLIISISMYHVNLNITPDLPRYADRFYSYKHVSFWSLNLEITKEPLFVLLQWIIVHITESFGFFLIIIWTIVFLNFYFSAKNLFNSNYALFILLSYANYFLFFSYILNTMRQGLAISFLILAVSLLVKKRKSAMFYILLIIAPLFHITATPLSISLMFMKFVKIKTKLLLFLWIIAAFLFITNLNQILFTQLPSDFIDIYTSDSVISGYGEVNRLDFLLFSIFFLFIALLFLKICQKNNKEYKMLIKIFLVFNTYFLLLGFIGFSDRLAAYSWMMIPLLIWKSVPNSKNERSKIGLLLVVFLIFGVLTGSYNLLFDS